MPETSFLNKIAAFLAGPAGLVPAPVSVGITDPLTAGDTPGIVLALSCVTHPGGGGGEVQTVSGALPVDVTINLGDPFLPGLSDFGLVSSDRLGLILPHGGLVRADGAPGVLSAADISVRVAGVTRPIAPAPPAGDQVSADALEGRLTFAVPLPVTGTVAAHYHLGTWERRTIRLAGRLALSVHAVNAPDVENLSVRAVRALTAASLPGVRKLAVEDLSSIGPPDSVRANLRARRASFQFQYDHVTDDPASSGGIIRRIPITAEISQ